MERNKTLNQNFCMTVYCTKKGNCTEFQYRFLFSICIPFNCRQVPNTSLLMNPTPSALLSSRQNFRYKIHRNVTFVIGSNENFVWKKIKPDFIDFTFILCFKLSERSKKNVKLFWNANCSSLHSQKPK